MPRIPRYVFLLLILVYLPALWVPVMDVDAAQYAEMAREMRLSDNWLQLHDRGLNYLDKPPLLLWLSALSMKLLGPTTFAYKFPSFLAALLSLYATYRFARRLYGESVARMAALILGTAQGVFLIINDVRTDTMLMCWVAVAMWAWVEYRPQRSWKWLVFFAMAIALGLMSKGPIALFVPLFAIGTDTMLRRQWRQLFDPKYLVGLLLVALLLVPMCIGLYQQFDAQPQAWVGGVQGKSGLEFFFWTQSFGRITGGSEWNNGAGPEFLLVSMLWAFLPWMLLFLLALGAEIRKVIKYRFKLPAEEEALGLGGFLLTYLSLCLSKYQLPHYIFVAFPFAALLTAKLLRDFLEGRYPKWRAAFGKIQTGMGALLLIGVLLILTLVFPASVWMLLLWAVCVGAWLWTVRRSGSFGKIFWGSVAVALFVNIFLTSAFYRPLLRYQLGGQVAAYLEASGIPHKDVLAYRVDDPLNALHFYSRHVIKQTRDTGNAAQTRFPYVLTGKEGLAEMNRAGLRPQKLQSFRRFKVSQLTPAFLLASRRQEALTTYWLVKMEELKD
jgi:4-amino-4-deoxy-L-arabinose transferase-like glycosyltransferase